jgi:2'-5' RNA ligase
MTDSRPACARREFTAESKGETASQFSFPAMRAHWARSSARAFSRSLAQRGSRTSLSNSILTLRLFLAIDPGDDLRRQIAGTVETIRANTSGIRWVRDAKLHVTLTFLGEIDESRIPDITAVASAVAPKHAPFSVRVQGAGVFPDWRRVRVVWFGLKDEGQLAGLATELRQVRGVLGLPPDRPFRAHLTLGRSTGPLSAEQKTSLSKALAPFKGSYPFDVSRVLLMRSSLSPTGSEYTELASFPLGGS